MCFKGLKGEKVDIGTEKPARKVSTISASKGGSNNNGVANVGDNIGMPKQKDLAQAAEMAALNTPKPAEPSDIPGSVAPADDTALKPFRSNTSDPHDGSHSLDAQAPAGTKQETAPLSNVQPETQSTSLAFSNDPASEKKPDGKKRKSGGFVNPFKKYEPTEEDLRLKEKHAMTPEEAREKVNNMAPGYAGAHGSNAVNVAHVVGRGGGW